MSLSVPTACSTDCDCRVPLTYLRETKKFVVPELPEAPLIVFINSRSGGRAGPKLAETLFHALGHSQVSHLVKSVWCIQACGSTSSGSAETSHLH